MNRAEIIDLANQLTERKAEKVLNMPLLFTHVLQDFCARNRYWWRKKVIQFNTAVGTNTYDLTSITTTPTIPGTLVEEVTKLGFVQTTSPFKMAYLDPVFDDEGQIEMLAGASQATPSSPSRYIFDANDYKTLRFDPMDQAYSMYMTFWAMPNPATDSASDVVPVVPPQHHKALVSGLVAKIFQYLYGEEDMKFITAKKEYEDAIIIAQARPNFATNRVQQLVNASDYSIRST